MTKVGKKTKSYINTGGVTVGTSVITLSSNDRKLEGGVQIVAAAANSGVVYIGARSTLTPGNANGTDGFPLAAGESIFIPYAKETDVYMIASAVGQKVYFVSY